MKNTFILKKNYEFKRLFSNGKFYYGKCISFYVLFTSKNYKKFGIALNKKVGNAVKRNHIKRLIRENYKIYEENIKNGIFLLVVINKKKDVSDISYYDIKKDFNDFAQKSDIWKEKND